MKRKLEEFANLCPPGAAFRSRRLLFLIINVLIIQLILININ